jgi:hypothetical protein
MLQKARIQEELIPALHLAALSDSARFAAGSKMAAAKQLKEAELFRPITCGSKMSKL